MADRQVNLREVLFEFVSQGRYVKVIAVDPETLTEISLVGDPKAGRKELQRIAIRKLEYVIAKRRDAGTIARTSSRDNTHH